MKPATALAATALAWTLAGCSGGAAQELLDTAQLEEKQNDLEHARKLYRQIVEKFPGSEPARRAEERLRAIGGAP